MEEKSHWIFRVSDGINFRNSKYLFWGVKRGKNDCIKSIVKKIKKGDILWFITSKKYGGNIIGMAEYLYFFDKKDEPLIEINTISNKEQNWSENGEYDLQIYYCNLYNTEKLNIKVCIQSAATIYYYERVRDKINSNLYEHYQNFILYGNPIR